MILNNNLGLGLNNKGAETMNITERINLNKKQNMEALYNGAAINKTLIESMGEDIDCSLLNNNQKSLAVMSYSYGSLVGVTTTGVSLGLTVASNPEQFFTNGVLNYFKIRKVFKNIGLKRIAGYRYESVFVTGKNKDVAVNKFGRLAEFVRVSRHEVQEFDNRLKQVDINACTVEDLKLIAKDLDVIGRAMQELAIDVTKDKSKDIGYNVMSFIEVKTKTHSRLIKAGKFSNNIDDVINEHIDNKRIESKYALTGDYFYLSDADVRNKTEMSAAIVEDIAGEMMEQINNGYGSAFEELIELFKLSNDSMYKKYTDLLEIAMKALEPAEFEAYAAKLIKERRITTKEELTALKNTNEYALKAAHMIRCARVALSSITSLYGVKQGEVTVDSKYIKEVGKKLRAGLYTEGAKIGFDPKSVVKMAIAASFCYINETTNKISKKQRPSLTELWTIFPKEFVIDYVTGNSDVTLNDMLTVKHTSYDLCLGDELVFDEGMAETEWGYVVVADNYTGKAIVTKNGLEAVVDHYSYEPTDILFLGSVYKRNVAIATAQCVRPTEFLSMKEANEKNETSYNSTITNMVKIAQACTIASTIEAVGNKERLIRDFVIKKDDKVSFVGQVLSKDNVKGKITDAIVSCNGAVIFF